MPRSGAHTSAFLLHRKPCASALSPGPGVASRRCAELLVESHNAGTKRNTANSPAVSLFPATEIFLGNRSGLAAVWMDEGVAQSPQMETIKN